MGIYPSRTYSIENVASTLKQLRLFIFNLNKRLSNISLFSFKYEIEEVTDECHKPNMPLI